MWQHNIVCVRVLCLERYAVTLLAVHVTSAVKAVLSELNTFHIHAF